jgi:hypothetical protein
MAVTIVAVTAYIAVCAVVITVLVVLAHLERQNARELRLQAQQMNDDARASLERAQLLVQRIPTPESDGASDVRLH